MAYSILELKNVNALISIISDEMRWETFLRPFSPNEINSKVENNKILESHIFIPLDFARENKDSKNGSVYIGVIFDIIWESKSIKIRNSYYKVVTDLESKKINDGEVVRSVKKVKKHSDKPDYHVAFKAIDYLFDLYKSGGNSVIYFNLNEDFLKYALIRAKNKAKILKPFKKKDVVSVRISKYLFLNFKLLGKKPYQVISSLSLVTTSDDEVFMSKSINDKYFPIAIDGGLEPRKAFYKSIESTCLGFIKNLKKIE